MRRAAKLVLERAVVWSGTARAFRSRMRGRVLVLAYHNVVPDGIPLAGDVANHLPLSAFMEQVASLRKTHDVVPLAAALDATPGRARRPRVAITFDDAYRGAVLYAVPELARQGLAATIFVAPAFLDGRSFWWDALAAPTGDGLDPALRTHALTALRGEDATIRAWATARGRSLAAVPDVHCAASREELVRTAALPGISLGSHSWSHPNLTRLDQNELRQELTTSLSWLRVNATEPLPWISYPYGAHDARVRRAAAATGYQAAVTITGGWLAPASVDRFSVPRVNVPPGLSPHGFTIRGAGLLTG